MAIITCVINWKGGVGKTTLTHHLAAGLAQKKKRILLLDLDPQCNLSFLAGSVEKYYTDIGNYNKPTIKNLFESFLNNTPVQPKDLILKQAVNSTRGNVYAHVDLVLSHPELINLDDELARFQPEVPDHDAPMVEIKKFSVIKNFLECVENEYDFVLIDCPPSMHPVTQNAIFASDYYLIPALPDHLSTVGISRIRTKIDSLDHQFRNLCTIRNQNYRPIRCAGIIFNKVSEYAGFPVKADQFYMNEIKKVEPELVYESYLVEGHGITDAALKSQPVYAYSNQRSAQSKVQRQIECLNQIVHEFLVNVAEGVLR